MDMSLFFSPFCRTVLFCALLGKNITVLNLVIAISLRQVWDMALTLSTLGTVVSESNNYYKQRPT